jgi:hypothetical protein
MKLKHGLLVRFGLRKGSLCCGNLSARRRASQKAVNLLDLNGVILKFLLEFSKVFPSGLLVRGGHSCSIKGLVVVVNILPALFLKEMILFVCLQVVCMPFENVLQKPTLLISRTTLLLCTFYESPFSTRYDLNKELYYLDKEYNYLNKSLYYFSNI